MQKLNRLVGWGVVILILTVFGTIAGVRGVIRANTAALFQKEISTYLSGPSGGFNPKREGVAKGKMVVVDARSREIDDVYFDLPDEMRAQKPEDVGTVVVLSWGEDSYKGQSYTDGLPAKVQTCMVRVYRKEGMVPLAERQLVGGPPPQMRKRSSSGMGPKPTTEVVDYLKNVYVQGMLKK